MSVNPPKKAWNWSLTPCTIKKNLVAIIYSRKPLTTGSITKLIQSSINVEVKFDDVSDLLGLHAIKKTFQTNTEISETKFIQKP